MTHKIRSFLEETKQEIKKVNWPTKEETIRYTVFTIGFSIVLSLFLGVFDFIFLRLLELIIVK